MHACCQKWKIDTEEEQKEKGTEIKNRDMKREREREQRYKAREERGILTEVPSFTLTVMAAASCVTSEISFTRKTVFYIVKKKNKRTYVNRKTNIKHSESSKTSNITIVTTITTVEVILIGKKE